MTEGIVIVDKPDGMTSHDVVARVRKKFNMRRVGHAGKAPHRENCRDIGYASNHGLGD